MSDLGRPSAHNQKPLSRDYWLGEYDLRPIALYRFVLGIILFYDLCDLLPNVRTFFSNEGVLPLPAFLGQWARPSRFCLLDSFSSVPMAYLYWGLSALAVLAMAIGFRSRVASVLSFIFIAGFQERLPPLFDGSDTVLRMCLFWHMFIPSNRVWSVDATLATARGQPLPPTGRALFVRLLQLQVAQIYFLSFFHKIQGFTWAFGSAIHYTWHLNHVFSRPWVLPLADNVLVTTVGTYFTLAFELGFLFLVNFPIQRIGKINAYEWAKVLGLATMTAMHIGIALTINVGLFSYLMPLSFTMFFEPPWAQALVDRAAAFLGPVRMARVRDLALRFPPPRQFDPPLASLFSDAAHSRLRKLGTGIVVFYFVICSWYAIPKYLLNPPAGQFPLHYDVTVPHAIETLIQASDVWSSWDMFSPEPLRTDYHLTAPAEYEDGSTGNLFGGDADGPGEERGFWFTRWYKYFENVTGGDKLLPLEWGRYMCRERNFYLRPGEKRLYTLTLYKDDQVIPPIGQPWPPVQRQTVWQHRCYDKQDSPGNQTAPRVAPPEMKP